MNDDYDPNHDKYRKVSNNSREIPVVFWIVCAIIIDTVAIIILAIRSLL